MIDHNMEKVNYWYGDFNVHNPGWICSTCEADAGGVMAEEMCQLFGLNQLIDFPTRGNNTLDLVMTQHSGSAVARVNAGTSDHITIDITLELQDTVPNSPVQKPTLLWQYAPWNHIRGAIKRELKHWGDDDSMSVDEAEASLDGILISVIEKYVNKSQPKKPGPIVWWNRSCQDAYKAKQRLFPTRLSKSVRYCCKSFQDCSK